VSNAQPSILGRRCALIALAFALFARPVQAQCVYSLSTTNVSVPSTANTGSLSVTTGTACSWTATSNVSWVTITVGASGSGIGTVTYSVAVNTTGAARSGTLTVAGQTVTINQSAGSQSSQPPGPPKNVRVIRT
jgi:hypothetical protein